MERLHAWFEARLPVSDSHSLRQRNIYIVPTGAGWFFAVLLLVLLLASINYQLSLGYALTFLLAGSALVSMHLTHGTLRGLQLHLRATGTVFAGDAAALTIVLDNPGAERNGIGLGFRRAPTGTSPSWVDVPRGGQATTTLQFTPAHRGWHVVPALKIETRFPFGLFRAWSIWRPAARVLAWPRPEQPTPPWPSDAATADEGAAGHPSTTAGEFEGVRPWRRGDSLRQIAWKKVARGADTGEAGLVSRETAQPVGRTLWLEWHAARTPSGDVESRLSRLAAWVVQADQQGAACGLRLPGVDLAPSTGDPHRRALLEALALWSR
jgi:uncharacterized protein (DUF58 family)